MYAGAGVYIYIYVDQMYCDLGDWNHHGWNILVAGFSFLSSGRPYIYMQVIVGEVTI